MSCSEIRPAFTFVGETRNRHRAGQVGSALLNTVRNLLYYRGGSSAKDELRMLAVPDAHAMGFPGWSALLVWANTHNAPSRADIAKMMGDHGRDPQLVDGGAAGRNAYGEGESFAAAVLAEFAVTLVQIKQPGFRARRVVGFPNSMGMHAMLQGQDASKVSLQTIYCNVAHDADGKLAVAAPDAAPFQAFLDAMAAHTGGRITLATLQRQFRRLGGGTGIVKLFLKLHPKLAFDAAGVMHIHEVDPAAAQLGVTPPPVMLQQLLANNINPASMAEVKLFLNGTQFFLDSLNFRARIAEPKDQPLHTFAVPLNGKTVAVQLYKLAANVPTGPDSPLQLVLIEGHLLLRSGPVESHIKLMAASYDKKSFVGDKVTKLGHLAAGIKKHLAVMGTNGVSKVVMAELDAASVRLFQLYRRLYAGTQSRNTTAVLNLWRSFITASNVLIVADLGGAFEVERTKDKLTNHAMCVDALYKAIMPQTLAFLARESSHFLDKPELDRLKAEADELDTSQEEEEEEEGAEDAAAGGASGSGRALRKRNGGSGGAASPSPPSPGKKRKTGDKSKPAAGQRRSHAQHRQSRAAAAAAAGSVDESEEEDRACAGCEQLHDQLEAVMKERDHFEAKFDKLAAECKQLKAANNQLHMDVQAAKQAQEAAEARAEQHARFSMRG